MKPTCIQIPLPVAPTLPSQFSFMLPPAPGLPAVNVCCQIRYEDYVASLLPPIPAGFTFEIPFIETINAAMALAIDSVQAYIDQLVPECPKLPEA